MAHPSTDTFGEFNYTCSAAFHTARGILSRFFCGMAGGLNLILGAFFSGNVIAPTFAAAVAGRGAANQRCLSPPAAGSRLSGVQVRRPCNTWNPSSDSFSLGNSYRSLFCLCPGGRSRRALAVCGKDENSGDVLLSGVPSKRKMLQSWMISLFVSS